MLIFQAGVSLGYFEILQKLLIWDLAGGSRSQIEPFETHSLGPDFCFS